FNLIISIIAIALVVVLAGASLYYGGDAFNSGNSDAKASTLINQAQQIQAAATLFKSSEGGAPETVSNLTEGGSYMTSLPKLPVGDAGAWEIKQDANGKDIIAVELVVSAKTETGITLEICETVNEDGAGVVFCTNAATADLVIAGQEDPETPNPEVATAVVVHMAM
ncbi:hypothetical protein LMH73_029215, partial [Vibrio splendidus]